MPEYNLTPELEAWMKLYEAPFVYEPLSGRIYDANNNDVLRLFFKDTVGGTFIAGQLNELCKLQEGK